MFCLGFDPYSESTKGLQDLIEKEKEERARVDAATVVKSVSLPAAKDPYKPVLTNSVTVQQVNQAETYTNSYPQDLSTLQSHSQQPSYPPGCKCFIVT